MKLLETEFQWFLSARFMTLARKMTPVPETRMEEHVQTPKMNSRERQTRASTPAAAKLGGKVRLA